MIRFITIAVLCVILSGCGTSGRAVDRAIELCADHRGICLIKPTLWWDSVDVECNDGVRIEDYVTE